MYFLTDISSFSSFCGNSDVFVGFNHTGFDNIFLEEYMVFPHSLDIMLVHNALKGERGGKLKEIAPDYGIITDETQVHQSSYDVYLTRSVLNSMLEMSTVRMVRLKE